MDEAVTRQIANFRSAIVGYNKTDVAELLADLEAQRESAEARQTAADRTIASMREELDGLAGKVETLTAENTRLEADNAAMHSRLSGYAETNVTPEEYRILSEETRHLREQLEEAEPLKGRVESLLKENARLKEDYLALQRKYDATADLRQRCEKLQARITEQEAQRDTIQDAIVSAQRMGKIVVNEAQQEADRLTTQAQQTAARTLEESQKRNDALQASYDRMLMDTSKMKSELIDLYRRHLSLLAEIPGAGDVPALEAEILETV